MIDSMCEKRRIFLAIGYLNGMADSLGKRIGVATWPMPNTTDTQFRNSASLPVDGFKYYQKPNIDYHPILDKIAITAELVYKGKQENIDLFYTYA